MNYRWQIHPERPEAVAALTQAMSITPLLAQCMINRDVSTPASAEVFLQPKLGQLADPFLLPNMSVAIERLFRARAASEPVTIFGDYDVDGVSSTAILALSLRALGWQVHTYLPHRLNEGYGLSRDGVENCLRQYPTSLLLAVDCGSTTAATIAWLNENKVDVIVLDHHQIGVPAPAALALVNPHLAPQNGTPDFRVLCSAGLAFKMLHAVVKEGRQRGLSEMVAFDIRPYLDLVALGTIADLVPLTGENRTLASAGLECLNRTTRPGITALKRSAQITNSIGVYEVGFQLAPRLNAAGRLESAMTALELLLSTTPDAADTLAQQLETSNRERQETERGIADEVMQLIRAKFNPAVDQVIVEGRADWHIGVVGIVASRVVREFHRPTIICGGDGEALRGSGRSIEGFDLVAALMDCTDLLTSHGGHAMAAGVSLRPENLDALRTRLNATARQRMPAEPSRPVLRLDAASNLFDLTLRQMEDLDRLQPIGQGNPPVQLMFRDLQLQRPPQRMGKQQQHAKLIVSDGAITAEAVMWNVTDENLPRGRFDLAAAPQINLFNGRRNLQLKVLDWRRAGSE